MGTKKRKFTTPHTLVIIVCLIFLAVAATYFVPAGEFIRYEDPVSGERQEVMSVQEQIL